MNEENIPRPLGKKTVLKKEFDTEDIIKGMGLLVKRFEKHKAPFCKWANNQFEPTKESLKKLWKKVRKDIKYQTDPQGSQYVQSPLYLADNGKGDCKSKTLFVNTVLGCLGIPYTTRFTINNPNDTAVKHVYTVAHLRGEDIIIDTVYNRFNKEARYTYKRDYSMGEMGKIGELALLEGGVNDKTPAQQTPLTVPGCDYQTKLYLAAKAKKNKIVEEIRQKKAYVPEFQNIDFHLLTEGQASLELINRELEILKVMHPNKAKEYQKAQNILYRAKEGQYCVTGSVSPLMVRYVQEIQAAKNKIRPANSYGIITNYLIQSKKLCNQGASVGNQGAVHCLDNLWSEKTPGTVDNFKTFSTANGQCSTTPVYLLLNRAFMLSQNHIYTLNNRSNKSLGFNEIRSTADKEAFKNDLFYTYGVNTPYRVSFNHYGNSVVKQLDQAINEGRIIHKSKKARFEFKSEKDYRDFITELNENSGVASNWLNHTFRTDPNQDAAVGSGLYYDFANKIPLSKGGFVNPNNLPNSVMGKQITQRNFINSCSLFSGVSPANVKQMTRLGVLWDSGGYQPETLLKAGWDTYNKGIAGHSVGVEPITMTMTTIIVTIIAALASAAGTIISAVNESKNQAESIDKTLSGMSQMTPPSVEQLPLEQDWSNSGSSGGGNNSGGSGGGNKDNKKKKSVLPLLLGGAAAAYFVTKK